MARLESLVPNQRKPIEAMECLEFSGTELVEKRSLDECRVALISSAGLMRRGGENFPANNVDYRAIEKSCPDRDILLNHVSVNFDRSAYAEDINSVFPRQLLNELADDGTIKHAAKTHYSIMGSASPEKLQPAAERLAVELKESNINTVCLLPV